jgi:hypothetical protein
MKARTVIGIGKTTIGGGISLKKQNKIPLVGDFGKGTAKGVSLNPTFPFYYRRDKPWQESMDAHPKSPASV